MTLDITVFMISIIVLQMIIGHLWHDIGLSYIRSILLMLFPLGIGVFVQQMIYFERQYPKWDVPQHIKNKTKVYLYHYIFGICLAIFHYVY